MTVLWPLLVVLFTACDDHPVAPELGLTLHDLDPPSVYLAWWEEAKECSGRTAANLDRVRWFTVDPSNLVDGSRFRCRIVGTLCLGFWEPPHTIVLSPDVVLNEAIVKHEMLHDQFQSSSEARVLSCLPRTDFPF